MKNIVRNGCLLVILGLMCATNLRAQTDTLNYTDARGQKQGKWVTFVTIDGEKCKNICYYKDGLMDSIMCFYYSDGNLQRSMHFKGGMIDGVTHNFWKDGAIQSIAVCKSGKVLWSMVFNWKGIPLYEEREGGKGIIYYKNGKWRDVFPPPDTIAGNITDVHGRKHGKWVTKDTLDGEIYKTIGYFKYGFRDSIMNSYYSNGNLMQRSYYKEGLMDGVGYIFRDDGTIKEISVYKEGDFVWMMQFTGQGCPHYDESKVNKEQNYYKDGKWLVPNIPPK